VISVVFKPHGCTCRPIRTTLSDPFAAFAYSRSPRIYSTGSYQAVNGLQLQKCVSEKIWGRHR